MEERYSAAKKVAMLGIAVNIGLLVCKLIVGYAAHSQAMIADGFNSAGDVFASVVALLGAAYAAKPKDSDHAWGHGKAEYLASTIIGFSMIAMAVYMIISSAAALWAGEHLAFSMPLVAVAALTIGAKAGLLVFCLGVNRKYNSLLIKANALDHRNDIFVTTGTLAAVLLSLAGVYWLDGVVGIAISVWIAYTGYGIIREASGVLMDTSAGSELLERCAAAARGVEGVAHIDSIAAKPVGANYILIVKVSVDREMKVLQSHEIAKQIELDILDSGPEICDVIVHINPDLPHEGKEA